MSHLRQLLLLILIVIIVDAPVKIDRGATIEISPEIYDSRLGLCFRSDLALIIFGRCQVGFNKSLLKSLNINGAVF